ncbi:type II toxin-antitoxin system VapC family toxin [Spirulina major CS-329]|uniref:type II toxin-antitoxin system VapC family toxin n=1 Tax=Spirulina TaxID=1154 RepID=UPI00232EAFC1|nr:MULTISPECIES: type II toxin-antitoxin system VapC family toxin [Spirulina]MDB9495919.1 type II toxin-antitoxin system VapC family toxin [Spirulina subsalsa CS-330]MDB9505446.1 type II toxin-antitoxin system VapC family toxin [Spirulina major CS-329]
MIVLDTNVLSELMRPQGSGVVGEWVGQQVSSELYITAITAAEILYGIALLPQGKRREALSEAAQLMFREDFAGRILPFDEAAAVAFASIAAERRRSGTPISQADAQIVSICRVHGAAIATRNVDDFAGCGIAIVNPWGVDERF